MADDAEVEALRAEVRRLRAQVKHLTDELADAHERIGFLAKELERVRQKLPRGPFDVVGPDGVGRQAAPGGSPTQTAAACPI